MHTVDRFYADIGHNGGWLFCGAQALASDNPTNLVLTRNALADWSLNRIAAGGETYNILADFGGLLRRLIEAQQLQEQFGGSIGPLPAAGYPPFTGASQLVAPTTVGPRKGIKVTDVVGMYTLGVNPLTSAAFSLNKVVYANNVAKAITNIPVSATALPLAAQANPYVFVRAVTTPDYVVDDLSDLMLELQVVMQAAGTIAIHGLGIHCVFNYD